MTRSTRASALVLLVLALASLSQTGADAQSRSKIDDYIAPAYPFELVSAKKVDRIAWLAFERGMRNVYTAAAPAFTPVRVTRHLEDDGIDLTNLSISDDGSTVVFVRGHAPNRGRLGRQSACRIRTAPTRTIWAARTAGGAAWKLAEGGDPVLSPDGRAVLYVKDGPDLSRGGIAAAGGRRATAVEQRREAVHHGLGRQRQSALVARTDEDRVCQRARRSHAHRRLRRRQAHGLVRVAERRPRHEPDMVARRQAARVHPPAGHAVRPAVAGGRHGGIGNPPGPGGQDRGGRGPRRRGGDPQRPSRRFPG